MLDADVIINLLGFDLIDSLIAAYDVYACSTVIDEIRFYRRQEIKTNINFRQRYVNTGKVSELSANSTEIKEMLQRIPDLFRESIDPGETESLTILIKRLDLNLFFCSCDARAIQALSHLQVSEKGIFLEKVLKAFKHNKVDIGEKHSENNFKRYIELGKIEFVQNVQLNKK